MMNSSNYEFHVSGEHSGSNNDEDGSDSGSEDGLPPLEKNMNHLYLEESDDDSE